MSAAVQDEFLYDPEDAFAALAGDIRDPYPDFAVERERTPIQRVAALIDAGLEYDANAPKPLDSFNAYSYEAVRTVLSDNSAFSSAAYKDVIGVVMGHTILEMDAPEHPRKRALVASAFRTKMMQKWSDTLVKRTVDELIDRFIANGSTDLVRSLTFPFPVKVIARILGLPEEDWPKFQQWSIELIGVSVDWERGLAASEALRAYFEAIVNNRRENPQDDVISHLAQAEFEGEKLSNEDIYAFLRLLLPAGAETTFRSSGNMLYLLMTHPEQLAAVREDRSLVPQVIDEVLRFEPPLLFILRTAVESIDVCGVEVPVGATVGINIGAANRDPARWENPDVFDIFREPKQHIAFAAGPHLCLGTHLAKLEMTVLLNQVLDRLPNLALDLTNDPHIHGMIFRSPTSLPVTFDAPAP